MHTLLLETPLKVCKDTFETPLNLSSHELETPLKLLRPKQLKHPLTPIESLCHSKFTLDSKDNTIKGTKEKTDKRTKYLSHPAD